MKYLPCAKPCARQRHRDKSHRNSDPQGPILALLGPIMTYLTFKFDKAACTLQSSAYGKN